MDDKLMYTSNYDIQINPYVLSNIIDKKLGHCKFILPNHNSIKVYKTLMITNGVTCFQFVWAS